VAAVSKAALFDLLDPVVTSLGYELADLDVRTGHHGLVRLYIDAAAGISVDDCEKVSRQVERVLDVEAPIRGEYTLEVSSPGLDRRLAKPAHFDRFAGAAVKVRLRVPLEGRRNFAGQLLPREGNEVSVRCEEGVFRFPIAAIDVARLVPDLEGPAAKSRGRQRDRE